MKNIFCKWFLLTICSLAIVSCQKNEKTKITSVKQENYFKYIDSTISPKEDFFNYVNGQWLKNTEIPDDQTVWGSFNVLRKNTDKDMLAIVTKAANQTNLDPANSKTKALVFYKSILDTVTRKQKGFSAIVPYFEKIAAIQNMEALQSYILELQLSGSNPFFNAYVYADAKNSKRNNLHLHPASLGLPKREFYIDTTTEAKDKRTAYLAHIQTMFTLTGSDAITSANAAKDVLAYETSLAKPRLDKIAERNPLNSYNPFKTKDLATITNVINWPQYFKTIGTTSLDSIIVAQPKYMEALNTLVRPSKMNSIKNFLRWHVINTSATFLTPALEKENWNFFSKTLRGAKTQLPLNERALKMVNQVVGEALGQLYVDEKFPPQAKKTAVQMVDNLLKAYESRINKLSWMSDSTKVKAIHKLKTMQVKIGYPDKWKDYSALDIASNAANNSYFHNSKKLATWNFKESIEKLSKPVDKTEWYMAPQVVNAYYNPRYNEIVFPAAILQPPFYDYKVDPAVNYGGIGAVIGHEISHGFDDQGSRFDAEGNLNNWWSSSDSEQFKTLGKKLATQFDAIEVLPGIHINGAFTLGENIGDLGGVNAAYDGLQLHNAANGKQDPIDGFTAEQRFFMSWATVWRTKMRTEALKNRIKTDVHSPGMYRGFVPLTNLESFHEAFNIIETDKLYLPPEQRVNIW